MASPSGIDGRASLLWMSAAGLARLIAKGDVQSSEVTQMLIDRIQERDTKETTNAVVVRPFEAALTRAAEADAVIAAGGKLWGPLHGVPITVKENNEVAGLPSTLGNPKNRDRVPDANSEPVQRLLDAGAVIIGKTNLAFDLNDVQSYNPVYGTCRNPHDLGVTPGGSSGGSAAALAAGYTFGELGGDIGGSIRTPAHCCGVFGHKATFGVIPCGVQDLVVKGPLARHPEDLHLMLDIVAGPTSASGTGGYSLALPREPARPLSGYRVAVWGDDAVCPVDTDITAAVRRTVAALTTAGCTVSTTARPAGFASHEMFELYKQLLASAENNGLSDDEMAAAVKSATALSPDDTSNLAKQQRWIVQSHHAWHRAHTRRLELRSSWNTFFEKWDILICPICCSDAWPHDQTGETDQPFWKVGSRVIPGNGRSTPYHEQVFWSGLTNACYNPSTVFPAGRSDAGLPVGLQAVGAEFHDHKTIAFVAALKSAEPLVFGFSPPAAFT